MYGNSIVSFLHRIQQWCARRPPRALLETLDPGSCGWRRDEHCDAGCREIGRRRGQAPWRQATPRAAAWSRALDGARCGAAWTPWAAVFRNQLTRYGQDHIIFGELGILLTQMHAHAEKHHEKNES